MNDTAVENEARYRGWSEHPTSRWDCWLMNRWVLASFVFLVNLISNTMAMSGDEGIFNYVGWLWARHGLAPYTFSVENKGPGVFILTAISARFFEVNFWFLRFCGLVAVVSTSLLLHGLGQRFAGGIAGAVSLLVFGLVHAWRMVNGEITGMTETFMSTFVVVALCLIMSAQASVGSRRLMWVTLAGISLGVATSFKQVGVLSTIGLAGFMLASRYDSDSNERFSALEILLMILGTFVGLGICAAPVFITGGAFSDYVYCVWRLALLDPKPTMAEQLSRFTGMFFETNFVLLYPGVICFLQLRYKMRNRRLPYVGLLVWLAIEFVGANASGRYFPHQMPLLPPLALINGIALALAYRKLAPYLGPKARAWVVVVAVAVLMFPVRSLGRLCVNLLRPMPDPGLAIGRWVEDNTLDSQYVYVHARSCSPIQAYSKRRSASKYFNTIFAGIPAAASSIRYDVLRNKPEVVPVDTSESQPRWLTDMLARDYQLTARLSYGIGVAGRSHPLEVFMRSE